MQTVKAPKPPSHLSADSKLFWVQIHKDYQLSPEHCRILQTACESYDTAQECRKIIAHDGLMRNGERHPLISVAAKSQEVFLRCLRDLSLQVPSDAPTK